jgi:hypothetical protein
MIETLFISVIVVAALFASIQLCIITVNALICNEAAFAAMRIGAVSGGDQLQENVKDAVQALLLPHYATAGRNFLQHETTCWNNTIEGEPAPDHANNAILKYNTNITYSTHILFPSLLQPFSRLVFFSGGNSILDQTARARMVKSPDEKYYYRAYPKARCFTRENEDE